MHAPTYTHTHRCPACLKADEQADAIAWCVPRHAFACHGCALGLRMSCGAVRGPDTHSTRRAAAQRLLAGKVPHATAAMRTRRMNEMASLAKAVAPKQLAGLGTEVGHRLTVAAS